MPVALPNGRAGPSPAVDFCNRIGHKPTSLERAETNTLSAGAHPRD
jgi:hypothetical protein